MQRKSVLLVASIVLVLSAAGSAFALLIKHEPDFYRRACQPPGDERRKQSLHFANDFAQFYQDVTSSRQWRARFNQDAINSFLDEQFVPGNWSKKGLPDGASEPRVWIDADHFRLGFRYDLGFLSTVISIDMRIWLAAKEANAVVLKLESLRAGALSIASPSLLEQVAEGLRQNNIEVTWYRHEGKPVAILRFQTDQDRPTYRLDHLVLEANAIEVRGRSIEAPFRAMLPPEQAGAAAP
jgi:hypothetical protein